MPVGEKKWDSNAERDLCLAVILGNQEGERARHNWPKVHAIMSSLGHGFTKDAISQHFTKTIMREFKARHGDDNVAKSAPQTPRKPRDARAPPGSKTPGSSKASELRRALLNKKGSASGGFKRSRAMDDSDDEIDSPSKKVKVEGSAVKSENRGREQSVTPGLEDDPTFESWLNKKS
ncbi:hypothetical protein B0T10DRAFT_595275 [Thelonectria olida]|uniref:Myb-like domain-containing protein n=1 Tax=Thelonectria olida TaxID=1576542 RepID=A0A9P9AQC7_9HYPO|nr:hypothetical protein B0T10DRAFT_595275 [Thelonectria olida]